MKWITKEPYICTYLQGEDKHEDLLLSAGEDVLDEGPPRPDQNYREEEKPALNHIHPYR